MMQKGKSEPKPVAVDIPVEVPDSSNGTNENAAPQPQSQPEPTPVVETQQDVKAAEPEPTPVATEQEYVPEPVIEQPIASTPEPVSVAEAPKQDEPVEEIPIKPLSGGNDSGMPSWQDFMKEMENDNALEQAAPVKRAPKPAAPKVLTPEEEAKRK